MSSDLTQRAATLAALLARGIGLTATVLSLPLGLNNTGFSKPGYLLGRIPEVSQHFSRMFT